MQCPKCQSPNVQLCSVAHEQGTVTSTTKTTGTTHSQGYGTGTSSGVMVSGQHNTSQTSTSIQRSAFAVRAGPPANPIVTPLKVVGSLIAFLVGITLLNWIAPGLFRYLLGTPGWTGPGFPGLEHVTWAAIAVAVMWLFLRFRKLPLYRASVERWKKSWICGACGDQFVPNT